ncbi:PREDICTED: monocarboxylate transporter 13-like isoform X2 [Priapulus caudatus]|nr:PREDICTED: monocarboxylate transporter 13-like isoform X2 [Priapulus caudatus]XP_014661881.1 PREDICTED: monocarboxylate transporter 13-like isoform X2 [Priapulus caudatus]
MATDMYDDGMDRGWAWLVLMASFFTQFLVWGISLSYGIFYVVLLENLHTYKSTTAWVGSISVGILLGIGPVASVAATVLSTRKTVIIGGVISALGLVASSFATNIYHLMLTYGIITGTGYGLAITPGYAILAAYFNKWRPLAFSVSTLGAGIGSLTIPPLIQHLVDAYSWRGTMLILGGISLNLCAFGALMKPVRWITRKPPSTWYLLKANCDLNMFRNWVFILFGVNQLLWNFGVSIVLVLLPEYIVSEGMSRAQAANILSVWGISNCLGRPLAGLLVQTGLLRALGVFNLATLASGVFAAVIGIYNLQHIHYVIILCGHGVFFGAQLSNIATMSVELFGVDNLLHMMGWCMLFQGAGFLIGAPVGGLLVDCLGTFSWTFYTGGFTVIVSSLLLMATPGLRKMMYSPDLKTPAEKRVALASEVELQQDVEKEIMCVGL